MAETFDERHPIFTAVLAGVFIILVAMVVGGVL
jgi:hypothetical protein